MYSALIYENLISHVCETRNFVMAILHSKQGLLCYKSMAECNTILSAYTISMGEYNTILSAYTMYRHLEQYSTHSLSCSGKRGS